MWWWLTLVVGVHGVVVACVVDTGGGGDGRVIQVVAEVVVVVSSMPTVGCPWGGDHVVGAVSCTKHVWYSEHGMYCRFEIILERAMSATHVAVILHTRTSPAYEEDGLS